MRNQLYLYWKWCHTACDAGVVIGLFLYIRDSLWCRKRSSGNVCTLRSKSVEQVYKLSSPLWTSSLLFTDNKCLQSCPTLQEEAHCNRGAGLQLLLTTDINCYVGMPIILHNNHLIAFCFTFNITRCLLLKYVALQVCQ